MGKPTSATIPTMTNMMEITMATIGRLIKNFDMATYPFSFLASAEGLPSGFEGASVLDRGLRL